VNNLARPSVSRNDSALESSATPATAGQPLPQRLAAFLAAGDTYDGAALLLDVRSFLTRFCAFPDSHAAVAVTLWASHAHMVQHFHTSPRLALLSPEPASGKTRVLEVLDLLVPESLFCLNASPATIFRTLALRQITLLADECDAIFTRRGKDDSNEDLRALLNAGYKRGSVIPRCVGPKHDVQNFAVYCAAALAGLGDLPDTIMSRSLIIRMRRRAPTEHVEPFRSRQHETAGHELRDRLVDWAEAIGPKVGASWPELPPGVVDRPAEVWEPLMAIAEAAGGDWPSLARDACKALCTAPKEQQVSLCIRLLGDLRTIFGDAIALHTVTILERLCAGTTYGLEADAPWNELRGKPLGERGLASMLKRYGVSSIKVNVDGRSLQGYRREALWDAWQRYLPSGSAQAEHAEPSESSRRNGLSVVPEIPEVPLSGTAESSCAVCRDCVHFQPVECEGLGCCLKYATPTAAEVPFACPGFQAAPVKL
jgi:hypothetical protein